MSNLKGTQKHHNKLNTSDKTIHFSVKPGVVSYLNKSGNSQPSPYMNVST